MAPMRSSRAARDGLGPEVVLTPRTHLAAIAMKYNECYIGTSGWPPVSNRSWSRRRSTEPAAAAGTRWHKQTLLRKPGWWT